MDSKIELTRSMSVIKEKIAFVKAKPHFNTAPYLENENLVIIGQDIHNLISFAKENKQLRAFLEDLICNLKDWLVTVDDMWNGKNSILWSLFSECACCNNNNFNRSKNDRREKIEDSIIAFVASRFSSPSSETINYLSLGGGRLLQDFIIITKLMLAGYKININLVDPGHLFYRVKDQDYGISRETYLKILRGEKTDLKESDILPEKIAPLKQFEHLLQFAATEMNTAVSIRHYCSMDDLDHESNVLQDVITVIDFDDFLTGALSDVIKAHGKLNLNGRMFLAVNTLNYNFSNDKCVELSDVRIKKPSEAIDKLPKRTGSSLNITVLSKNFSSIILNFVIPYLHNHATPFKNIVLTLPDTENEAFLGNTYHGKNHNLDQAKEYLISFLRLFLPTGTELQVNYLIDNKNFKELLSQLDEKQDLIICYGKVNSDGNEALFAELKLMHDKFHNADFICGMSASSNNITMHRQLETFRCEWTWNSVSQSVECFEVMSQPDMMSKATLKRFYNEHTRQIENEADINVGTQNKYTY